MLKRGKINIGWKICMIFNHYSVRRYFRCWDYYHIAQNYTRHETYHKCSGDYKSNECTAIKKKYINCVYKNKMYNLKINDKHDALSVKYPTYIKALAEKKKENRNSNKQQLQKEAIIYTNAQSVIAHQEEIQQQVMKRMNPALLVSRCKEIFGTK